MGVEITSTTDTQEQVQAALGETNGTANGLKVEKSESVKTDEIKDAKSEIADKESEAEETEESETEENHDEGEDDLDESTEEKPKKKNGFKKRIERFQKRLSEKDQEIEHWKREALKSQTVQPKDELKTDVKKSEDKPKPESFDTHEEYIDALTDWKYQTKEKERIESERIEKARSEYNSRIQNFQSKVTDFAKSVDDFDEVLEDVDDIVLQPSIQDAIMSSDIAPQLMYELAKNRKEYERINSLNPLAAAREIGRFEAKLIKSESQQEESKTKTPKVPKAPPPVTPIGSNQSKGSIKSPDDMTQEEYNKWREEQIKLKGR